ncbi:MAG: alpha/beta fold hydrolase [Lentisphaerae bacterium]|nr:alpha/beta fold hydrolase [Lentisphaerota bacterium]
MIDPQPSARLPFQETSFLLETAPGALAAILHAPNAPLRTALFVPPLAEERKACHRILCDLARAWAAEGTAVLRFDYRGTGDSPGDFADFSVSDWLADAEAARAWLRDRYPQCEPVVLGIRFGAALASRLVAPCAARLLIEPVGGTDLLKQLLQRNQVNQMVAYGRAPVSRARIEAGWLQGTCADLDGYPFTPRLAADLAVLAPGTWTEAGCVVSTGADTRAAHAAHIGAPASERLALRLPAFWNTVGRVGIGPLSGALADALHRLVPAGVPRAAPGPLPESVGSGPITFASPSGTIRGWVDWPSPARPPVARLLLIHGWSGDRTGPHRMFVTFARRLAAAGVMALRIDLSGRGDSDGDADAASIEAMTADTRAAVAWMRQTCPDGGPMIITAICSGCKVAFCAAAEPGIDALTLWSPESMGSLRSAATGRRHTWRAIKTYAIKLTRRETWVKLTTGRIRADMVKKTLVHHETRSAAEATEEDRILQHFRRYPGRIRLIFGGSDPDAAGSAAAYAAFCARHSIRHDVHIVPHAGHSFYSLAWESDVLARSESFILHVARGGR